MTDALVHALGSLEVVRNPDGTPRRDAHPRPLPQAMIEAAAHELDPDRRVLVMLSARTPKLSHGRAPTPFGYRPLVRRAHSVATKPGVILKAV